MLKFYIFEAGATKTAFVEVSDQGNSEKILPPFNANRNYIEFENAIKNDLDIIPNSKIIFYGSGLGDEGAKEKVRNLFKSHLPSSLEIESDILGAARALFVNSSGVFGIMGTGGLAAAYDGKSIIQRRGGYGYLLGDIGGGFELGKQIIKLWLDGDLSESAESILVKNYSIDKVRFVSDFYKNQDLNFISNLVPFVIQFQTEPSVNTMLENYFKNYIEQNIVPLCQDQGVASFSAVGSIAYLFKTHIVRAASEYQLNFENVVKSPIKNLIDYHK